jgi:hypothetical protein
MNRPPVPFGRSHPLATNRGEVARTCAWERRERESDVAWHLFQAYRDSAYPDGPRGAYVPRDVALVARALGLPLDSVLGFCTSFQWQERCNAYDRALEESLSLDDATLAERRTQRTLAKLRTLAESELDKLVERAERGEGSLQPRDVEKILNLVLKVESTVKPKPKETSTWDLSKLSNEEIEMLDIIMRKCGGSIEGM